MKYLSLILFLWFAGMLPAVPVSAHDHDHPATNGHTGSIDFIENKGQWTDQIKYKAGIPDGALFLTDEGFVYNFVSREDMAYLQEQTCGKTLPSDKEKEWDNKTVHYHAYKVKFWGANNKVHYQTYSKRDYYHNYFIGNDSAHWAGKVGLYGTVEQKNIYNGIDVRIYSKDPQSVKYDFIVAPDADPGQIVLSYEGVLPELTKEGHLSIKTTVNEVIEQAPYTYQEIEGEKVPVKCKYALKKGRLSFEFPEDYDKRYALVIDPDLIFATYSGAIGLRNFAHSAAYDKEGNTYTAALAEDVGWPVTTGAYQVAFPMGLEATAALSKYNTNGSALIFATYFGNGAYGVVQPNTIRVNANNEVFIAGNVTTPGMPVTVGAYQPVMNGVSDMYIARFSMDGNSLLASTFIGGSGKESNLTGDDLFNYSNLPYALPNANPTDIAFDNAGNVWVTSNSGSSDFPVTPNAFQQNLGGRHDVVLFKLDPGLTTLLYSTYIGGSGWDGGIGIEYNNNNNTIGVVGYTASSNFPTTTGAYITAKPGGQDGFALLVDNTSYQVQASTYLGTSSSDVATRLAFDCDNNFFVAGRTQGNYPITATPLQGAVPTGYVFIDKLTPNLSSSLAATRTGAAITSILPTAMIVDTFGNILVATLAADSIQPDMPLTPDAFTRQPRCFYFAAFAPDFSNLLFGSYFGTMSDHFHPGIARIDPAGIAYQSVCSNTGVFPTSSWAYAPVKRNNALMVDNITFKFDFGLYFVQREKVSGGGAKAYSRTHCVRGCKSAYLHFKQTPKSHPVTVRYRIAGDAVNGVDYEWIPDSIVIAANRSSATLEIKGLLASGPSFPDPKHVVIHTLVPMYCSGQDVILFSDTVWIYDSLYVKILTVPDTVCPGEELTIEAEIDTTLKFVWSPVHIIPDPSGLTIHPRADKNTVYYITVVQPGAPATCPPRTASVTAPIEPEARIVAQDILSCYLTDSLDISIAAEPPRTDYSYQWLPPDFLRNDYDLENAFFAPPGTYKKEIIISSSRGCLSRDSFTIQTLPPFKFASLSPADTTIRLGDAIRLNSESEAVSWLWIPATYLDDAHVKRPWSKPEQSIIYNLVGTDQYGCTDTVEVRINIRYTDIWVPNAFSPNDDGFNDVFKIENVEGKRLLDFSIFNRFGQTVFTTVNAHEGWDGTFNGQPSETGVYFYIIRLISWDGTTKTYRGDISLIR